MSSEEGSSTNTVHERHDDNVASRRPKKMRRSIEPHDFFAVPQNIKLKVPPFSPDDPDIWFALLEGQFENYNITQDHIKFNNVIANLDVANAKTVKDVLMSPPSENRYQRIKSELIKRLSASHERKTKQLLTHEKLGDRRPSQFLRHLQDLAGPTVPDDFLKSIWISRLPENIQTVLASQDTPLAKQVELADRIQEIASPCVASASASQPSSEIAELKAMVAALTLKLDDHTRGSSCCHVGRARPQQRSSPSRQRQQRSRSSSSYKRYPICWYHSKHGDDANRCLKPCDYKTSGNARGGR